MVRIGAAGVTGLAEPATGGEAGGCGLMTGRAAITGGRAGDDSAGPTRSC